LGEFASYFLAKQGTNHFKLREWGISRVRAMVEFDVIEMGDQDRLW
jgi:hypothetical protein